ncbi:MAG TPA: DoxX family protein [Acidimicrobiales bacterium]|nr:DoxX family protein [Acidimicrobiales bacterium]
MESSQPAGRCDAVLNGFTECFGGVAVGLGLLSRLAAAGLVGDMVVAMVTVAWNNGIVSSAAGSGYELNLALLGAAFVIAIQGPGRIALDRLLHWVFVSRRVPQRETGFRPAA